MANIDLNSKKWCELAYEGKNQAFGGFVIRQEIGKRHIIAFITSVVAIALAFYLPTLIEKLPKEKETEIEFTVTEVEMANLEEQEVEKNDEIEPIVEAPPPPPLKSSIKFTAPVITADENVSEEEEIKTQDEMTQTSINISIADVQGVDTEDAQDIADFQEVIAEPEPEEEELAETQAVEDTAYFQMRQRINELLSELDEADRKLLTLRFGLEGGKPLDPETAGRKLGLTPEEVVAREAAALSKLRNV